MKFKLVANTFLLVILLLFCLKTVIRNADWKNNETLFLTDVISSPNSIRTNNTVASIYLSKAQTENSIELKNEYFKKTISYCEKTIKICPTIPEPYVTLGTVYYLLSDYNKATTFLTKAYQLEPTAPCSKVAISALSNIYFNEGNRLYRGGEPKEAIRNYLMSIEFNKSNIDAWYNLSKCYSFINDTKNAEIAKLNALKLEPKY
jgi:tetratricopeptide (TPR) repeat protein